MKREYYSDTIESFLSASSNTILGKLVENYEFPLEQTQRDAWLNQIFILKKTLQGYSGKIYFEYSIPRMGKRIDVILIIGAVIIRPRI